MRWKQPAPSFAGWLPSCKNLDQGRLKLHKQLVPTFKALKEQYGDMELTQAHPGEEQPGGVVSAARRIKSAQTFEELRTATREFQKHPRVTHAATLLGLFDNLEELLSHLPSAEDLAAMDNFDTGNIKAAAKQWVDKAGDNELRKTKLLPLMQKTLPHWRGC